MMFDIYFFLFLLSVGYIFGSIIEKRHFNSLQKREEEMLYLPMIALKKPLLENDIKNSVLVNGSVVISIDFFKKDSSIFLKLEADDIFQDQVILPTDCERFLTLNGLCSVI